MGFELLTSLSLSRDVEHSTKALLVELNLIQSTKFEIIQILTLSFNRNPIFIVRFELENSDVQFRMT